MAYSGGRGDNNNNTAIETKAEAIYSMWNAELMTRQWWNWKVWKTGILMTVVTQWRVMV
jgi:hypothetical protein